jgi:hypothetical protein
MPTIVEPTEKTAQAHHEGEAKGDVIQHHDHENVQVGKAVAMNIVENPLKVSPLRDVRPPPYPPLETRQDPRHRRRRSVLQTKRPRGAHRAVLSCRPRRS